MNLATSIASIGEFVASVVLAGMLYAATGDPEQPPHGWSTKCRVVYIVDGDTLDVEVRRIVRIRLKDCWSPESRTTDLEEKKLGLAAKANLKELADGKDGTLFIPGSETLAKVLTLNRALGYVYVDGKSLSQSQREAGHATAEKE